MKIQERFIFRLKLKLKRKSTSGMSCNVLLHCCQFELGFHWGIESGAGHCLLEFRQRRWKRH